MTFPKIQSVNFFTDFPIFFDGSFQILMIGKGLISKNRNHNEMKTLLDFAYIMQYFMIVELYFTVCPWYFLPKPKSLQPKLLFLITIMWNKSDAFEKILLKILSQMHSKKFILEGNPLTDGFSGWFRFVSHHSN